mgnify:CR=1 FL=1
MKKTIILLSIVLMIVFVSCESTGPEKNIKTPDEMTWTTDTLKADPTAIQLIPRDILAFSPSDVWLACLSDASKGLLWHFDGKTWTENNIRANVGGMAVEALAGNSNLDLWAAGRYGTITSFLGHYDATKWTRYAEEWYGDLLDIIKDDEGNFWACGRSGLILKYSSNKWKGQYFKINLNSSKNEGYFCKSIVYYNKKIHILVNLYGQGSAAHYHIEGLYDNWAIIDSFRYPESNNVKFGTNKFVVIDNKLYSCGDLGVFKYDNKSWEQIMNKGYFINDICGINENYLIAVGYLNTAFFYDGTIWKQFSKPFKGATMSDQTNICWTNGKETFIGAMLWNKVGAVVFHGK